MKQPTVFFVSRVQYWQLNIVLVKGDSSWDIVYVWPGIFKRIENKCFNYTHAVPKCPVEYKCKILYIMLVDIEHSESNAFISLNDES